METRLLFANTTTTFNYTGSVVTFTAPVTATYDIVALGAKGGTAATLTGGIGAEIGGDFNLVAGQSVSIAVGGAGGSDDFYGAGGGGGTFVVSNGTPLVIAGGGGGGGGADFGQASAGGNGQLTTAGQSGNVGGDGSSGGAGGTSGSGGATGGGNVSGGGGGGGGGGFSGNGTFGAGSFSSGLAGGSGGIQNGGFGGGSAGTIGGGGGGGYSGGGGGSGGAYGVGVGGGGGGGGGSFNGTTFNNANKIATNLSNPNNTGNGFVTITGPAADATSTVAAAATAGFSASNQSVTLSATVTDTTTPATVVNSGAVAFSIFNGATQIGSTVSGNVTNGSASASYTLPGGTAMGQYTIRATYTGTTFAFSTDSSHKLTIQEAKSLVVTTVNDTVNPTDNKTSLREAIDYANSLSSASTVTFDSTVFPAGSLTTITLGGSELEILNTDATVTVNGDGRVSVSGNDASTVFYIDTGVSAELDGLTITGGNGGTGSGSFGGGIDVLQAALTLKDDVITGNSAGQGAGVAAYLSLLTIDGSTFSNNEAENGGGIYAADSLSFISNSTVSGNSASAYGGGLITLGFGVPLTTYVVNSTFSGNSAGTGGSAIVNAAEGEDNELDLIDCTIAGNTGATGVGAVFTGQVAIGGTATTTYKGTIFSNAIPNITFGASDVVTSLGHNLSSDGTGSLTATGDLPNTNPLLSALGSYGGTTQTMALLPGSPAIDAGAAYNDAFDKPITADQRGVSRPQGSAPDIGAFESRAFTITATGGNNQSTPGGSAFASPLQVTVVSPSGDPVAGGVVTFTPPASGASATLGTPSATIASNGTASTTATANSTTGTYLVTASTAGAATPASFTLTNSQTLSIGDVSKLEGNSGTTLFQFPVTRTSSVGVAAVDYVTVRDTANDIDDYNYATGSVVFNDGETTKYITVGVKGDTNFEPDQKFNVVLSNPVNATIADGTGVGTIVNDDTLVGMSINDVAITEGNSGTKNLVFTVTLNAGSHPITTVKYGTSATTATSGTDFTAVSGTLTFGTFVTSQTITVPIKGDTTIEPDETFKVTLSNVTGGATITDGTGVGTILNDDFPPPPPLPKITINDVIVTEGTGSGVTLLSFTVKLDKAATGTVSVKYATANGTASSSSDYTAATGTVTFAAGQLIKTISIQVKKDALKESDETLFVNLSNLTGAATVADGQGKGTIKNDD